MFYVYDPKAMHIFVKDHYIYGENPRWYSDHHRRQRKMMNPVFSTNHMRNMVPVFQEITNSHSRKEPNASLDPTILISILNANRNREIWGEDTLEWKPKRWLSPLLKTVTDADIPGVYSATSANTTRTRERRLALLICREPGRDDFPCWWSGLHLEMKVIISTLIESFTFKPSQEIVWTMGLSTPKFKDMAEAKVQLHLVVDRVATL
ncbi:hypothetical protein BJ138DRAFT_1099339 [Hygrophoropsis aurantiaca]|uniref:Uncharacterized protein n=1 Tax=Hygrophoropsis aurantiaca TaxID=72124 RepID=A0ACB8AKD6_9AGAM|nr:hypothetical protein BJ138DRAFT_1099339 [Hygrophoropsis aurantiaca]